VVDRSGGSAELGVPFFPLIELNFPTFAPDEIPEDLAKVEATKPGSRTKIAKTKAS
jgi:orotate phosphoribosyltransferase